MRHIPSAWETIPPEASAAARERGSAASLRRILGDELAGSPGLACAAYLTTKAATSAPTAGRVMYAGLRARPVPGDPVARLWHSANMLREHRGDGHVAALVGADGRFTDAGRETKRRVEALTDELATPPYEALSPAELDELIAELEPITARLVAAGSR